MASERDNIRINSERSDGTGGFWELLGDKKLSATILEQEEH